MIVIWRITEQCNLGCHFCAYDRRLIRTRTSADPKAVLTFGAVLRDYAADSGRNVLVSWLGGEPLLWPLLGTVSQIFRHEYGLRLGITTNGTALQSDAVRRQIMADYDRLTVSIDGMAPFHDWVRDMPGLFARLERVFCALRALKAEAGGNGPVLSVNSVLMRDNFDQFTALCETLAAWGVEELTFNALGGHDRPDFHHGQHLLPQQMARLHAELPAIRARVAPLGLRIRGSTAYVARLESAAQDVGVPVDDCGPGQSFLFIDEQGMASPCSFTTLSYGVPIGAIRCARELAGLPQRFAAQRATRRAAACDNCLSTQVFGKFAVHDD